jgi:hypothetical protein
LLAYQAKWLPHTEVSEESLAQALFLEQENQHKNTIAIANGIGKFFNNG